MEKVEISKITLEPTVTIFSFFFSTLPQFKSNSVSKITMRAMKVFFAFFENFFSYLLY